MLQVLASSQSAAQRRQAQGASSIQRAESRDREAGEVVTDRPSPKAAYAGALGEPYITTQHQPAAAFAVAVPHLTGGYRRKNFRWANDPAAALEQARTWRDQVHQELHDRPCPARVFHRTQENSGTEIPGVREAIKMVKKKRHDGQTQTYAVPVVIAEITLEPSEGIRKAKT